MIVLDRTRLTGRLVFLAISVSFSGFWTVYGSNARLIASRRRLSGLPRSRRTLADLAPVPSQVPRRRHLRPYPVLVLFTHCMK